MGKTCRRTPGPKTTPSPSLGQFGACCGQINAVVPRFERLISGAWFTRKVSVLIPAHAGRSGEEISTRLKLQQASYELSNVSIDALGDQRFVEDIRRLEICCLSRGRGLACGNVVAVFPPGELVASVDAATFERLGLEEPAAGARSLRRQLQPIGHRHVCTDLSLSKTRRQRGQASRWQELAPSHEICAFVAYCGREEASGYGFEPLCGPSSGVCRIDVPTTLRCLWLRPARSNLTVDERGGDIPRGARAASRPPLEALAAGPAAWGEAALGETAYGDACEDLLDWLGALHLNLKGTAGFDSIPEAVGSAALPCDAKSQPQVLEENGEEVWCWTLGDSLMGPSQLRHSLGGCLEALAAGCPWFLLSVWGAEDSPISHRGTAHGFDINGAHHMHLLVTHAASALGGHAGSGHADANVSRALLLESTNALSTAAVTASADR